MEKAWEQSEVKNAVDLRSQNIWQNDEENCIIMIFMILILIKYN